MAMGTSTSPGMSFPCEMCGLSDLQSETAFDQHCGGQKHQKALRRLQTGGTQPQKGFQDSVLSKHDLFFKIASGVFRNIVVFSGAGISTASGISDFRSPGQGLFDRTRERFRKLKTELKTDSVGATKRELELAEYFKDESKYIHEPAEFFSRRFVTRFSELWRTELEPEVRNFVNVQPSLAHEFCAWLHSNGWLRRVYTQNVDGLHTAPQRAAGESAVDAKPLLPEDMVVECHGSVRKGNLVMYDDTLPPEVEERLRSDFPPSGNKDAVDLVMVFGTSLQVAPFCAFPNLAPKSAVRVLVNTPLSDCLENAWGRARRSRARCRDSGDIYHGMNTAGAGIATSMKVAGRQVSLCPRWTDRGKYPRQLLAEEACDDFVRDFFEGCARGLSQASSAK